MKLQFLNTFTIQLELESLRLRVAMLAGNGACHSGLSRTLQRSAPVGRVGDR